MTIGMVAVRIPTLFHDSIWNTIIKKLYSYTEKQLFWEIILYQSLKQINISSKSIDYFNFYNYFTVKLTLTIQYIAKPVILSQLPIYM